MKNYHKKLKDHFRQITKQVPDSKKICAWQNGRYPEQGNTRYDEGSSGGGC